ncbi:hypothetical protein [Pseudonocardia sp.]|uniref:hypothetical protein n=1 Tax=Pseudonocardia sp. TaxID=60912 RepID=UPI0026216D8D|nr:hypothetical protein [Pseudonocardia sp.]MCW2716904.1 hypothetical protein [Pseudonocardia sp.]
MGRVYALFPRLEEPAKQLAGTLSAASSRYRPSAAWSRPAPSREPADDPAVRRVHLGAEPASP